MKSDTGDSASANDPAVAGVGVPKTLSDVIENLGLTGHTYHAIVICWLVYFVNGWGTTLVTFLLDAASQEHGNWVAITSAEERLTIRERSLALFFAMVVSAACNLLLGNLTDFIGRIPVSQGSVVLNACVIIGFALANQKFALILLVIVSQVDISALSVQSLLAEWSPAKYRGLLLVAFTAIWNVGRLGITLLWAVLPPAKQWVAFFLSAAIFPVILGVFLIVRGHRYESPRWLAVTGRMERCVDVLRLAASTAPPDAKELPDGWDNAANLQLESDSGQAVHAEELSKWAQVVELLEPSLRLPIMVLGFCYFAVSFSWSALFFWLMEYFKMLGIESASVPVMIAAPVGKMCSVAILLTPFVPGQCFVDRLPRTLFLKIGFFASGLCVALLCATTNVLALTVIMFVCNVFEGFIWGVGHIYVAESFPTTVRNGATGLTWALGAIGGIVSAAVTGELMAIWVYLPMVSSATILFTGCAACFLLTEERGGSTLIDTMGSPRDAVGYGTCDAKSA